MVEIDQQHLDEIKIAKSPLGKKLLIGGVVFSLSIFLFLNSLAISFDRVNEYANDHEGVVIFIALSIVLIFPFTVGLFPWIYATEWRIGSNQISFFVPAPKGASKFWFIENRDIEFLREGRFYCTAIRRDMSRFRVPTNLIAKELATHKKVRFVLKDDRLVLKRV